ncbi:MAG: tetratricopeptide repeat protein [Planctomycetes bacterium]|nr:tetratricopeptide repeat protein [Planctomycetota bacterium]
MTKKNNKSDRKHISELTRLTDKEVDYLYQRFVKSSKPKDLRIRKALVNAFITRGGYNHEKKEYNAAISKWTKAIKLDPNCVDAYCNRGNAYYNKKDYAKAIIDHTKEIELNPTDIDMAYLRRGVDYWLKGDLNLALTDFTKALEIKPDNKMAQKCLSKLTGNESESV